MKSFLLSVAIWLLFFTVDASPVLADVKIDSFDAVDPAPQNDPVACWAASMSAALKVKGVNIDQDELKRAVCDRTRSQ
jgi:hypothetical protein